MKLEYVKIKFIFKEKKDPDRVIQNVLDSLVELYSDSHKRDYNPEQWIINILKENIEEEPLKELIFHPDIIDYYANYLIYLRNLEEE
jgi:hypothetical protein